MINIDKINSGAGLIIKSILIFCLIYSIHISEKISFFTTEKIVIFILLVYSFAFSNKRMESGIAKHNVCEMLFFQVFLLIYTSLISLLFGMGSGANILSFIIYFLITVPLELYCLINLLNSKEELMRVLFIVSMTQTLVVLGTLIDPSFAYFIDTTFNNAYSFFDYQEMRKFGYPGGISCITSTGALQLSLGVVSGMYLYQKSNGKILYLFSTLFIVLISTIVARTSIFIGVSAIVLFCLTSISQNGDAFGIIKRILLAGIICFIAYLFIAEYGDLLFGRLMRLGRLGLKEAFFDSYFDGKETVIPELSWKTIIGTGMLSGESGSGVRINADGNFIRMYCALGLPLAILFYFFLFFKMFKLTYMTRKNYIVFYTTALMSVIMIIGEFKEPFFYTRYLFVFFNLVVYFYEKDEKKIGYKIEGTLY